MCSIHICATIWIVLITANSTLTDIPHFICMDGTIMKLQNICNGKIDCADGSDETKELCYHIICPPNMFRCQYGACIDKSARCDGTVDCADKSDENRCGKESGSCEIDEFPCTTGQCIKAEKVCDDNIDCKDASDESKLTCEEFPCPLDSFKCKHGGCVHLDAQCDGFNDCIDGSDESDVLCSSLKCEGHRCMELQDKLTCNPITSGRISAKCEVLSGPKKGMVPCDKPLPIGTKVNYECKQYYKPINKLHLNNRQMICQLDGRWNREILKCEPDCGKAGNAGVPMVVNGWESKVGKWPWYTAIYVLEEGKWIFWCGGSLITEKIVLTAAHCTWKMQSNNMRVAFGKFYSDFNKRQDFTVIRDVKNIIMQPAYQDQIGNYGSDIAVLILNETVEFNPYIRPVCIDWQLKNIANHLKHHSIGTIVGMGVTEKDTFSDTLREITLPVVENEKCLREQNQDFKKYVTYTAFCAGWANGSGVCNGDSGGGLVFPNSDNAWVLQGLVSVSPRRRSTSFCDPNFFTVFTKVGMYINWLSATLNTIHPERTKLEFGPALEKL